MAFNPEMIVIYGACWVISIGLHEAGHAFTADRLGDSTPADFGRLTLNPLVHMQPVMTAVVLPVVLISMGMPPLGAASTPYNPANFRKPIRDTALVAIAGPIVNIALAGFFSAAYLLFFRNIPQDSISFRFLEHAVWLNLILVMFNLLPVPGLDGGSIVRAFLPRRAREIFDGARQFGILIAIILVNIPAVSFAIFFPAALVQFLVFPPP